MNCIHSVATTTDNRRYRSRKQNTSVFTRKTGNMGSVFLIQILSIKTKQIISAELITFLTAESEVELKSLLMRVKEESEKAGLKLNIKKTKAMASHPITSWQIEEEKVEAVTDFLSWAPKSLWNGDCSHEIKSYFLTEMKAMTNLDSVLKSKETTLLTKIHIVKAMVFPIVMYGYESWTVKKAEHHTIDAFELWCWRRAP